MRLAHAQVMEKQHVAAEIRVEAAGERLREMIAAGGGIGGGGERVNPKSDVHLLRSGRGLEQEQRAETEG